ncbi:thiamine phosphate synthase [Pontibacter rugosus]|uniref:Thiamine phosphate synthase n=1 Tax=Pontibacter rugosus TaxID=1745966 RepID=A0ABW3SMY4_9BACT
MQLIVITSPDPVAQEQQICAALFELGLQTLHLRRPDASIKELQEWLKELPKVYHRHIMLHSYHQLAEEFEVKGLHFREADRAAAAVTPKYSLAFSTSFHSLADVQQPQPYVDYGFLSPIFQSISKKDYPAAFTKEKLQEIVPQAKLPLIALGGVTAEKLPLVQEMGFKGAAVLGAVWEQPNPVEAFKELLKR